MNMKKQGNHIRKWGKRIFTSFLVMWFLTLVVFFVNPNQSAKFLETYLGIQQVKTFFVKKQKTIPCEEFITHAWQMNDDVAAYWKHSRETGLKKDLTFINDIRAAYHKGEIELIEPTKHYEIDTMWYSFAFAKTHVKTFLDTLALRFQANLKQTDLEGTRFLITSLLRTKSSVARLRKNNRNAIKNSSHLHGTTFDVSYATFMGERSYNEGEIQHLKEALAKALFDLRNEGKCWVKYELYQTCFHVVVKKQNPAVKSA